MDKKQEQQIIDYYSTTGKYIRSNQYSNSHETVFTKEGDKYRWLVLEQKNQNQVEVRQTDRHGIIIAWDIYDLINHLPQCVGVVRLCEDGNIQIHFSDDEINLIYQCGEQGKAGTCANLTASLSHIKDSDSKQIVNTTVDKLNALSEESCMELIATTKRWNRA